MPYLFVITAEFNATSSSCWSNDISARGESNCFDKLLQMNFRN